MKQEYEFEEWIEDERAFYVRLEYACEPKYTYDDPEPCGYRESVAPIEIAEWQGRDRIGPAMNHELAVEWVAERKALLIERINAENLGRYEYWQENR